MPGWTLPPGDPVSDWEKRQPNGGASLLQGLNYTVASNPQYYLVGHRLVMPATQAPPVAPPSADASRLLIDVTFDATMFPNPAGVASYWGFLGGQMLHSSNAGFAQGSFPPATTNNNIAPFVTEQGSSWTTPGGPPTTIMQQVSYDPISLPVGGVNYPIWTQPTLDPMTVRCYAKDASNPGNLWGVAVCQILDSLAESPAVYCLTRMWWQWAEADS